MKATEQYFPVVLFIMLYTVVLTFESVIKISKVYHSKLFKAIFYNNNNNNNNLYFKFNLLTIRMDWPAGS